MNCRYEKSLRNHCFGNSCNESRPIHHEITRRKTNVRFGIIYYSQIPTRLARFRLTGSPFKIGNSDELIMTLKYATVYKMETKFDNRVALPGLYHILWENFSPK